MTILPKALMVLALLATAGCNNPDRFGARTGPGGVAGDGFGAGAGGIDSSALGSADDPASAAYFNQTIGDRVLFVVDQSTLTDEARATLDGQATWLQSNPSYNVIVEGHADEQGTREYNLALGARRAASVQDYLVSRGVSTARLRTVSYGKERPVAVCSSEECYARNRRAVTVIQALGV